MDTYGQRIAAKITVLEQEIVRVREDSRRTVDQLQRQIETLVKCRKALTATTEDLLVDLKAQGLL